jgi:hypothetical protein
MTVLSPEEGADALSKSSALRADRRPSKLFLEGSVDTATHVFFRTWQRIALEFPRLLPSFGSRIKPDDRQ